MKKNIVLPAIILFFLMYYLASPWNYSELEKVSIVTGIALDMEENVLKMSFEAVDLGERRTSFVTEGTTLSLCVEQAAESVRQPLYFTHAKVLILSKEFAEKKLDSLLEFVTTRDDFRLDVLLVLAEDEAGGFFEGEESENISLEISEYFSGKSAVKPESAMPFEKFYSPYKSGKSIFLPELAVAEGEISYKGVALWN